MMARDVLRLPSYGAVYPLSSGMHTELIVNPHWHLQLVAFIQWMQAAGLPITTIKLRSYHVRRFALDSGLEPLEVGLDDLVAYLGSHDWSPNYRRSHRSTLRAFYGWAQHTGRLLVNPAESLPSVAVPIGRPRPASELAVKQGLATGDRRVRLMIQLAAQSGLRCREIALVHTDDILEDLVGYSLRVHGKGSKVRVLPLNDSLAYELRRQPAGWVFPGQDAGHLSAAYVSKLLSRSLPDGITAHQLRHRFASVVYSADRDIRAVQELLGHASVATTQIYTAVPDGALRRAVDAAA